MTREEFLVRRAVATKCPPGRAKGSWPVHKGLGARKGRVSWQAAGALEVAEAAVAKQQRILKWKLDERE